MRSRLERIRPGKWLKLGPDFSSVDTEESTSRGRITSVRLSVLVTTGDYRKDTFTIERFRVGPGRRSDAVKTRLKATAD